MIFTHAKMIPTHAKMIKLKAKLVKSFIYTQNSMNCKCVTVIPAKAGNSVRNWFQINLLQKIH